jgi:hypothetical protein
MEGFSFQTPALAGVGVLGGQIGFARARDVEARVCKRVEHAAAISD